MKPADVLLIGLMCVVASVAAQDNPAASGVPAQDIAVVVAATAVQDNVATEGAAVGTQDNSTVTAQDSAAAVTASRAGAATDVAAGMAAAVVPAQQQTCPPGSLRNAQVRLVYSPRSASASSCLTVASGFFSGRQLVTTPCSTSTLARPTQTFWMEGTSSSSTPQSTCQVFVRYVRFRTAFGNLCLDIRGRNTVNAAVELQPCVSNKPSQVFGWSYPGTTLPGRHRFTSSAASEINSLSVDSMGRVLLRPLVEGQVWDVRNP